MTQVANFQLLANFNKCTTKLNTAAHSNLKTKLDNSI